MSIYPFVFYTPHCSDRHDTISLWGYYLEMTTGEMIIEWARLYQKELQTMWDNRELRKLPPLQYSTIWSRSLPLDIYAPLKNEALFRAVQIEPGGYAVSWGNDIDISEYELWKNGRSSPLL